MDGNRRWAKQRFMPTALGHAAGAKRVRDIVKACADLDIPHLSLFAFSTENWKRPADEVAGLMGLFMTYLQKEVDNMNANGVRLRIVGDIRRFDGKLQTLIAKAQADTSNNKGITLTVAANYGGRWDIMQAVNSMTAAQPGKVYAESDLLQYLSMAYAPEPDLFIRTGGEQRISNFLLWQLAYAEMYFTDTLWPDFDVAAFDLALVSFQNRERRFGRTSEQVKLAEAEVPELVAVKR